MLKLANDNENDNKYFKSLTNYDAFIWNSSHVDVDGEVIMSSLYKQFYTPSRSTFSTPCSRSVSPSLMATPQRLYC